MKNVPINNYPTSIQLDIHDGKFEPCLELEQRKVSDLAKMFSDKAAIEDILRRSDRLVYEIRYYPFFTSNSDMALGTTIIFPGKVGNEYGPIEQRGFRYKVVEKDGKMAEVSNPRWA